MGLLTFVRRPTTGLLSDAELFGRAHAMNDKPEAGSETSNPLTTCPANLQVTKNGNDIDITGTINFRRGDYDPKTHQPVLLEGEVDPNLVSTYLGWMNTIWTNPAGKYHVTTHLRQGPNGVSAYVGNPVIGGEAADLGGPNLYLAPPDALGRNAHDRNLAAHGLGHIFGNRHGRGLMNPFPQVNGSGGGLFEEHIDELLKRCGLLSKDAVQP